MTAKWPGDKKCLLGNQHNKTENCSRRESLGLDLRETKPKGLDGYLVLGQLVNYLGKIYNLINREPYHTK